jgi:hypothetical protein
LTRTLPFACYGSLYTFLSLLQVLGNKCQSKLLEIIDARFVM